MNAGDRFLGWIFMMIGCLVLIIGSLIYGPVGDILRWPLIICGWVCVFLGCRSYNISICPDFQQSRFGFLFGLSFVLLIGIGFIGMLGHTYTGIYAAIGLFIAFVAGSVRLGFTGGNAPVNGLDYEYYCAEYLRHHGFYNVRVTPGSGDFGADIVAYDASGDMWVFQCKRYEKPVGNTAVQEVIGSKRHYGAKKGAVMTNTVLTEKARQLAWENDIELFEMID